MADPKNGAERPPLYAEPYRQQFHFSDHNSWMNDINGTVYFRGLYHLYYQKTPDTVWGNTDRMHWGHAVSADLLHWEEKPCALAPDADGAMWSGTAWADEENRSGRFPGGKGGILAAYSTEKQEIGLAYSTDGDAYEKIGIVLRNPGGRVDFRDPKLFFDETNGKWTMLTAGGKVRIYQSSDLRNWTQTGENEIFTECPDLFRLRAPDGTEKWVLSCAGRAFFVGRYANGAFTPESDRIETNVGPDSYAGIIFENQPDGRTLMMHWMDRWEYAQETATDWCSNASLVSELSLRRADNGAWTVCFAPADDVYDPIAAAPLFSAADRTVRPGEDLLAGVTAELYRLRLRVALSGTTDFTFTLRKGSGDATVLRYRTAEGTFTFDRGESVAALPAFTERFPRYTFTADRAGSNFLTLDIYVDAAGFECYVDRTTYFAALIRPQAAARAMSLTTEGALSVAALTVEPLASAVRPEGNRT